MFTEAELKKIKNPDTRKDFNDVLQSYYSKNFKASILLLYNLTINDLYRKMQLMSEKQYFNLDKEITKIENILKEQEASKYSKIEEEIYNIYKSKKILNHSTYDLLDYLKKVRNKCAHPSFFREYNYQPSTEEVSMFISKIYNDILIVDVFIKNPYDILKKDIEEKQWGFLYEELIGVCTHSEKYLPLKNYFSKKHFNLMTENNFVKLFEILMKLIFIKKNDDTIKYQYVRFMVLEALLDYLNINGKITILKGNYKWDQISEENLEDDKEENVYENEWFGFSYLMDVIKKNPIFLQEIKLENEILYNYIIEKINNSGPYLCNYWILLFKNFDEFLSYVIKDKNKDWNFYCCILRFFGKKLKKDYCLSILELLFQKVPEFDGYDKADKSFEILINFISEFSYNNLELSNILEVMNNNRQFYDTRRQNRNKQIFSLELLDIELSNYENLGV